MIYKMEEYVEQGDEESRFPVKRIEVLTPVDGSTPKYVGHVALGVQTPLGVQQIPISFEIEAHEVTEAFSKFEEQAEPKIEEARKGLEEEMGRLRRESTGRIIRPDELAPGSGGKIIDLKNLKP